MELIAARALPVAVLEVVGAVMVWGPDEVNVPEAVSELAVKLPAL